MLLTLDLSLFLDTLRDLGANRILYPCVPLHIFKSIMFANLDLFLFYIKRKLLSTSIAVYYSFYQHFFCHALIENNFFATTQKLSVIQDPTYFRKCIFAAKKHTGSLTEKTPLLYMPSFFQKHPDSNSEGGLISLTILFRKTKFC